MESVSAQALDVLELDVVDKQWWNDLVRSVPWGTLYQTSLWADFHQAEYDMRPHYLLLFWDGVLIGCCLVIEEKKYHLLFHERQLGFVLPALPSTYRIELGPVLFGKQELVMTPFCEFLKKEFKKFYCINPNYFDPALPAYDGFEHRTWGTHTSSIVSLVDWMARFDSVARKKLKAGLRKNCQLFIVDAERFGRLYTNYRKQEKLFPLYPRTYFQNLKKHLGEHVVFFGLQEKGVAVAFCAVRVFNGIVSDCYSVRKKHGDCLLWKVLEWCHAQGLRTYDFCGFNPGKRSVKEEGIYHFKKKWLGKEVIYERYSS